MDPRDDGSASSPRAAIVTRMKIDAHQHFWTYRQETHGWIDGTMTVIRRDFLPVDLESELLAAGFDGCIAVQAAQTVEETEWLLGLAGRHRFIRGVVGWVDLRAADLEPSLSRLARHPKLAGIRHIAQSEPDPWYLVSPEFLRGLRALAAHDLTYDVLVRDFQLPAAIELADTVPSQRFVLDHLGKPRIRERLREPWGTHLRELAARPNVFCKLSGLVTEADWSRHRPADFAPYLDAALDAFGPSRLLIGSDWPVCLLAASYRATLDLVLAHLASLSDSERAAILGGTALRAYPRLLAPRG